MKALSVKQPYAIFLVTGEKPFEIRSWPTSHRGELLICASKSPNNLFVADENDVPHLLFAGCQIGIVNLVDCRPMTEADAEAAMCDYEPGLYAWVVESVCLAEPKPVVGRLQLFDVADDLIVRLDEDDPREYFDFPPPQGEQKLPKDRSLIL